MDYKQSGVDIDAADALIDGIKPLAKSTNRRGSIGGLGGFGALFDIKKAGYKDPILVTSTDGVGTKLKIAIETDIHDTIGIDLVAMCVNDIIVQGAEPLSFLDYFATGKLDANVAKKVIEGITEGCKQANCVLAGGETAEMPGMYADGHYDLAGFCLGAAERGHLLPKSTIKAYDMVFAFSSSGVHSNGFSLVNRLFKTKNISWDSIAAFGDGTTTYGEEFLKPTKIYVKMILEMHQKKILLAGAHITGGGVVENLPRVMPKRLGVNVITSWRVPEIFKWLKKEGDIDRDEMLRTFNCGVGFIIIVAQKNVDEMFKLAKKHNETPIFLGHVEGGISGVHVSNPLIWS